MYFEKHFERGFGTFPLKGRILSEALIKALDVGYRAIDTAQMYENESDIGKAIKSYDVNRDELFITSKVPVDKFGKKEFLSSVELSLKHLNVDTIDVLLLHWPPADGNIEEPLEHLQQAQHQGLCQHIGVSNFTASMLRRTKKIVDNPIVTNQVEFHPLLNQEKLLQASSETGISLASYCSVARGEVFKYKLFDDLATSYGVSTGQIVLRWILQKGVSINTMSTKFENIQANFDVMNFTLSSVDMSRIDALTHKNHRIVDKNLVPYAPAWD